MQEAGIPSTCPLRSCLTVAGSAARQELPKGLPREGEEHCPAAQAARGGARGAAGLCGASCMPRQAPDHCGAAHPESPAVDGVRPRQVLPLTLCCHMQTSPAASDCGYCTLPSLVQGHPSCSCACSFAGAARRVACTLCIGNTWGICLAWGNQLWAACCAGWTQQHQQTMWRSSGVSMASATPSSKPATLRCRAFPQASVSPSTAVMLCCSPPPLHSLLSSTFLPAPNVHLRRTADVASSQGIARGLECSHLHELALPYLEHAETLWSDCLWATRWLQAFWSATLRRQPGCGRAAPGTAQQAFCQSTSCWCAHFLFCHQR